MKGLKPCPFCGGTAWLREKTLRLLGIDRTTWKKKARIAMYCYCGKCKARGGVVTGTFSFVTYISTNTPAYTQPQTYDPAPYWTNPSWKAPDVTCTTAGNEGANDV